VIVPCSCLLLRSSKISKKMTTKQLWIVVGLLRLLFAYNSTGYYPLPKHIYQGLADLKYHEDSVMEASYLRAQLKNEKILNGQPKNINELFPTWSRSDEIEESHINLVPRPFDKRRNLVNLQNAGMVMSPLNKTETLLPMAMISIIDLLKIAKYKYAKVLFDLICEVILGLIWWNLLGLLYEEKRTKIFSIFILLNPISIMIARLNSFEHMELVFVFGALYAASRRYDNDFKYLWRFVEIVCRIFCSINRPGYNLMVDMCCFLLWNKGNYSGSHLVKAGIECGSIAIWGILLEFHEFISSLSIPTSSGIKDVQSILYHVIGRSIIPRFYANKSEISLSPMWLINNLLFYDQLNYTSGMYMIIVVLLISLPLALRVALVERQVISNETCRPKRFQSIMGAIFLIIGLYFGLDPNLKVVGVYWSMMFLMPVASAQYKGLKQSAACLDEALYFVAVNTCVMGIFWTVNEATRLVAEYSSNANLVFSGSLIVTIPIVIMANIGMKHVLDHAFYESV